MKLKLATVSSESLRHYENLFRVIIWLLYGLRASARRLLILTCILSDRTQLHHIKVCCTLFLCWQSSTTDETSGQQSLHSKIVNFNLCRKKFRGFFVSEKWLSRCRSLMPSELPKLARNIGINASTHILWHFVRIVSFGQVDKKAKQNPFHHKSTLSDIWYDFSVSFDVPSSV